MKKGSVAALVWLFVVGCMLVPREHGEGSAGGTGGLPGAGHVTVKSANVRSGPGQSHSVLTSVKQGQELVVLDPTSTSGWYEVRLPDGTTGWCSSKLIALSDSGRSAPASPRVSRSGGETSDRPSKEDDETGDSSPSASDAETLSNLKNARAGWERALAASQLGSVGSLDRDKAREFVQPLMDALNDKDAEVRASAIDALGKLGAEAKPAMPALTGALQDREKIVQLAATGALAELGKMAEEAIPALTAVSGDTRTSKDVRESAAIAIKRIRRGY